MGGVSWLVLFESDHARTVGKPVRSLPRRKLTLAHQLKSYRRRSGVASEELALVPGAVRNDLDGGAPGRRIGLCRVRGLPSEVGHGRDRAAEFRMQPPLHAPGGEGDFRSRGALGMLKWS